MTPPLVVIGGGGHAKVVVDVLQSAGAFRLIGYTARDPGPPLAEGVPFLGSDDCLAALRRQGVSHAFVAIGHNASRDRIGAMLALQEFILPAAVSIHAFVSASARTGNGAVIMPGAVVNAGAAIGDLAIVNTRASVDHDCIVGRSAHIAPGVSLCGGVAIGPLAFIGAGASIIPGIKVGARSIVGAGAAVVCDLPDDVTAVGVPARLMRRDDTGDCNTCHESDLSN